MQLSAYGPARGHQRADGILDHPADHPAALLSAPLVLATASGVFGEMQAALNSIWKAKPDQSTVSRLIRARIISLGLFGALGFLLIVSLAVSAALTAFSNYLDAVFPGGKLILPLLNFIVSLALLSVLFAAIYKVLPDRHLQWRDVIIRRFFSRSGNL